MGNLNRGAIDPMVAIRQRLFARKALPEEEDVGGYLRSCILFECGVRQADGGNQVGPFEHLLAGTSALAVKCVMRGNDGGNPAWLELIKRLDNEIVVNR